jgi:uncharacterized membrane protein
MTDDHGDEHRGSARALAMLLAAAGVSHFLVPSFYDDIVPHELPGRPRSWTQLSGIAELACAAAVLAPRTRRQGAAYAAALFVLVFPANIQMAVDWRGRPRRERAMAYGRLPLQVPLVVWALRVSRHARRADQMLPALDGVRS